MYQNTLNTKIQGIQGDKSPLGSQATYLPLAERQRWVLPLGIEKEQQLLESTFNSYF